MMPGLETHHQAAIGASYSLCDKLGLQRGLAICTAKVDRNGLIVYVKHKWTDL